MTADRDLRILEVLAASDRDMYGLELVSAGVANRWSLYVVLASLEERGLISSCEEDGLCQDPGMISMRRRVYRISDAGRAALVPVAIVR